MALSLPPVTSVVVAVVGVPHIVVVVDAAANKTRKGKL